MSPTKRGGRIRGKYTRNERSIIDPFKEQYRTASSPSERQHIAMSLIFKALFVYWTQNDGVISNEDAQLRGRNLADWLQNNWRPPRQKSKALMPFSVRRTDVAYRMKKEAVAAEISSILGVENAAPSTPGWFETRTVALRNIVDRMTPAEQRELDEKVAQIEKEGYPAEQKQTNAAKHCTRRFHDSARHHWFEMGVLSISVVAYLNKSNQLAVEIHDRSLDVTGIKVMETFQDRYREKLREIQRLWLDYVRELLDRQAGKLPHGMGDPIGVRNGRQDDGTKALKLGFSDDGFPRLPAGLNIDELTKKEACSLLRSYLTQNYLLATYRQSDQVPYKAISESASAQSPFIDPKYLPPGFSLVDPQNMKLGNIKVFFTHIQQRERTEVPGQVFRFRQIHSTRRKGELMPTHYPDEIDPENPPLAAKKKVARRKKKVVDTTSNGESGQAEIHVHLETSSPAPAPTRPDPPLALQPNPTVNMLASTISNNGKANDFTPNMSFNPNASRNHDGGNDHNVSLGVQPAPIVATYFGSEDQQSAFPSAHDTPKNDMYQRALEHMYKFDIAAMNQDDTTIFPNSHQMNNYGTELPHTNLSTHDWNNWASTFDNLVSTGNGEETLYNYQGQNVLNVGYTSTWSNTGHVQADAVGNGDLYLPPIMGSTRPAHLADNATADFQADPSLWDQSVPRANVMIGSGGFNAESYTTNLAFSNGNGTEIPQELPMGALATNFQPGMYLTARTDNDRRPMRASGRPLPVPKFKNKPPTTPVGEPVPPPNSTITRGFETGTQGSRTVHTANNLAVPEVTVEMGKQPANEPIQPLKPHPSEEGSSEIETRGRRATKASNDLAKAAEEAMERKRSLRKRVVKRKD